MAKNRPLRKNTLMPPKAPRLPKSPVGFSHKQKPTPEKPFNCICEGGPYNGEGMTLYRSRPATAVFSARSHTGRYVLVEQFEGERCIARWEDA